MKLRKVNASKYGNPKIPNVFVFGVALIFSVVMLVPSCSIGQEAKDVSVRDYTVQKVIDTYYHSNVLGVSETGVVLGRDAMSAHLLDFQNNNGLSKDFQSHYKLAVTNALYYEIGSFQTEKGGRFAHVAIWAKENDKELMIAEVVYEMTGNPKIPKEIAEARKKWEQLCNEHDVRGLVTGLYTDDAIYYNRGRVLRGHDELTKEYSYMQNPSYALVLTPKHIEMVTHDIAFEIGKCSGSYNLPYIIIWKKQPDGNWKVYMDSNY